MCSSLDASYFVFYFCFSFWPADGNIDFILFYFIHYYYYYNLPLHSSNFVQLLAVLFVFIVDVPSAMDGKLP